MAIWVLAAAAALVVPALLCYAFFRFFRERATRIEHSRASVADKVHHLQRLMLTALGVALLIEVTGLGGCGALAAAISHRFGQHLGALVTTVVIIVAVIAAVLLVAPLFLGLRAIKPSFARVRDVPLRAPNRRRTVAATVAVLVPYAVILGAGIRLIPRSGPGHDIGLVLVYFVGVVVLATLVTPVVIVRILTKPLPAGRAERMHQLADSMGVRVRGFRVLKARGQKVANAAQFGLVPGLRYILVTDYLVDHLDSAELEAVVAHELGHARRHHVAIKLGAVLGVWVILEALALGLARIVGHGWAALLIVPVFIAVPVGTIVVQGLIGVRLEEAADEIAAESVGREKMVTALEKLGDLNDTKRNTGRAWAILTQHPGLQMRIDHLRAARAA